MMNDCRQRAIAFFSQYINVDRFPGGVWPDGETGEQYLKAVALALLDNEAFESVHEMKMEAIKKCDVILPDWLFER